MVKHCARLQDMASDFYERGATIMRHLRSPEKQKETVVEQCGS